VGRHQSHPSIQQTSPRTKLIFEESATWSEFVATFEQAIQLLLSGSFGDKEGNMLSQYRNKARSLISFSIAIFMLLTLTQGISQAGNKVDFDSSLVTSPIQQWNTFMGGTSNDQGNNIALDGDDHVYIVGSSFTTWGSPLNPYAGLQDAFVVRLTQAGNRQWNTFLGSASSIDNGNGVAVDKTDSIYIVGTSETTWGSPLSPFEGSSDAFVAKLNSVGALQWLTFVGGNGADMGRDIAVDEDGNVYIVGTAGGTWGSPINPYPGGWYAPFVAKLNSDGAPQWHTYWGGGGLDTGEDITVDDDGNVYVAGVCYVTWGSPVNPHSGGTDACVAKLDTDGTRQWNTFLGSSNSDGGSAITIDESGNVYVTGYSYATWGAPIIPHSGSHYDVFVAGLRSDNGTRRWNTFAGFLGTSYGNAITVDWTGNIYVAGECKDAGVFNRAFLTQLDADGTQEWAVIMGATYNHDASLGVAADRGGHVYVTGRSLASWGTPIDAYTAGMDAFAVKFALPVQADLAIYKSAQPGTASPGDTITYALTFSNMGYLTATDVLISDIVPSQLINLGYTNAGATITPTGTLLYEWEVQALAPGNGGVITITGVVSPSLNPGIVLNNTATITSATLEGNPNDNHSSARVLIPSTQLFLPLVVRNFGGMTMR
jgi:uncharacterized repeat protein (TIGR01451 family)